ncbi:MAG: NTP transferase domain-containing protein [Candidatus Margulisbacteria bacterium]|nr:NTP transferase domain-containing protein [Candidatus Margulisiibacteriota bacterium]MBU1616351.1 NTP transferase domain-containing protein [Candidatus Margulisiibacteriota bacterium]
MKGIILAGGTGSRLYPLTKVTNKHLLPVGKWPMIYHPIKKLVNAGIEEILIVTGVEHMGDIVNLLGSGREFGCRFTYKVQDEAGGIAQALGLAENFVGSDKMIVILGDNIFQDDLSFFVEKYSKQTRGARILIKKVQDPQRFGVVELNGDKIVSIEEKPKRPKSNFAVTGIYFFDAEVFTIIKKLKPSGRGELEITDVNRAYAKRGGLGFDIISGWWSDAGTFESLERAAKMVENGEG